MGQDETDLKSVRIRVKGLVQRVYFRAWAVEEARGLGLDGWVRNRRDGSVELLLSGPGPQVDRMIVLCHQGPEAAQVSSLSLDISNQQPDQSGFHQHRTV